VSLREREASTSRPRVYAFDAEEATARAYAEELGDELRLDVRPVAEHVDAVRSSDVCVTCTPSRQPFLFRDHVKAGTFIAAVGADSADKHEIDAGLMAASVVVTDVMEQCASFGDLHHALDAGVLTRESVHAELADLVTGRKPGRRSTEEITIFDSTGTALEDVAAAVVYEKAVAAGVGLTVALGA
jgi:ornithine cyclodeaminase/alanine dehydrogenase-like protein (mu-crystallin family)